MPARVHTHRLTIKLTRLSLLALLLTQAFFTQTVAHAEAPAAGAGTGAPPPPKVSIVEVQNQTLRQTIIFPAQIRAVEQVEVRPQVSGMLASVNFRDGARVEKGQLLYSIDNRPFTAEVNAAEAAVAQAEASLRLASKEQARGAALAQSQTLSREAIEQRDTAKQVAEANLRAAQARLATARINLDYTQIRAPIAGTIERSQMTAGNLVTSPLGSGTTLLTTIIPSDTLYVYFQIDEATQNGFSAQSSTAPLGENIQIALQGENTFQDLAPIDYLAPSFDPKTGTRQVRAQLANPKQRYAPGQFARVRMNTAQVFNNPTVPARAIGMNQSKQFVIVVNAEDVTEMRPVTLGPDIDGQRPVLKGLKIGERVIVEGLQKARPGSKVTPELFVTQAKKDDCNADNAQPTPAAPLTSCFSANKR